MNQFPAESRDPHSLDWLAFCYISGELTGDQIRAFEERLSTDQVARDAVAGAVEFTQLIHAAQRPVSAGAVDRAVVERPVAAGPSPSSRSPTIVQLSAVRMGKWRRVAWITVGTSACLLLILVTNGTILRNGTPVSFRTLGNGLANSAELAVFWAESRSFENDLGEERDDDVSSAMTTDINGSGDFELSDSENDQVLLDPPGWMMTAVENSEANRS